ncbi:iron-sulfur cluster assembly scaffold protein [Polymorphobacter fuscus]|uniref:Iron-sulfur cluster assembly scaffold protein n=1 Tax=Sandarakinorhabdus fusca TaxID=1439888 RepID=A0A7C9LGX9_9SPHN|nr:iron-sulfur cluster assembly scaffold protein [Polymorphobacter fuscus]KAB7646558.1 iron-sulfur cluster assembly scaffold protein [Polymorphobacter fuscus]MQT17807.1 iron-sulfur cluster assembly scaffold protein [Polymorphobacter fuscus]NJC09644.1 NifU-like protein involved in Fe-S cluster formation [Polymorphobacter fuscus]
MSEALYNTRILRLAAATAGAARLDAPQGSAVKVSPVCGSKVTADIDLDGDRRIVRHGQEVRACALGQAAATLVGTAIIGSDLDRLRAARAEVADWLAGHSDAVPSWPGMDVFAPARPHRARHPSILLAFDAAIAAAEQAALARAA